MYYDCESFVVLASTVWSYLITRRFIIHESDLLTFSLCFNFPSRVFQLAPQFSTFGKLKHTLYNLFFCLLNNISKVNLINYLQIINCQCPGTSDLSCYTKERFKFALFFCRQSHKEKVFHSTSVSPTITAKVLLS